LARNLDALKQLSIDLHLLENVSLGDVESLCQGIARCLQPPNANQTGLIWRVRERLAASAVASLRWQTELERSEYSAIIAQMHPWPEPKLRGRASALYSEARSRLRPQVADDEAQTTRRGLTPEDWRLFCILELQGTGLLQLGKVASTPGEELT
jgi:hypothetical protein